MPDDNSREKRTGAETRAEILRVALELFTAKGFEGTSTRDISSALGITKSALYYHFDNKDAIVADLMKERRDQLDDLNEWIRAEPAAPDLVRRAALRWIDGTTIERLQVMRLAQSVQPTMSRLAAADSRADIRTGFDEVVSLLVPTSAHEEERLFVRMTFDTLAAALLSARGTQASLDDVKSAARRATEALTA